MKTQKMSAFSLVELPVVRKRACPEGTRRAFSLVELLIVIMIVGILATVGIVSYSGTQRVARDNQRKSDLAAIATAYQMYHQDKKVWQFNPAEGVGGVGWFNYVDGTTVTLSPAMALIQGGYLTKAPRDPLITSDAERYNPKASQYMKYDCIYFDGSKHGIVLFARLEDPKSIATPYSVDFNPGLDQCMVGAHITTKLTTIKHYSPLYMNYAIWVK